MFTSRAEYRLSLRQDNADLRLTEKAHELGCIDDARWQALCNKREAIEKEQQRLKGLWIRPNTDAAKAFAEKYQTKLEREYSAADLLNRPEVDYRSLTSIADIGANVRDEMVIEQIDIQAKYAGYLSRQQNEIEKHKKNEASKLPDKIDYDQVTGLSNEIRQKLIEIRPDTIGQASRIPGVTPAAISLLLVHLKRSQG